MLDPNSTALIPYVPPQCPIPEEPTSEEIVDCFVNEAKKTWVSLMTDEDDFGGAFKDLIGPFNEGVEREEFTKRETVFRRFRPFPDRMDAYEPAGGLQWSMTPAQIHSYVQGKFESLRKSGLLLRRSEFESQEDSTKFRKPGRSSQKCGGLDRLWGAEYLRENLAPAGQYRVPRFVLVIEDKIETLLVKIYGGSKALAISSIDTDHGELLVEKVNHGTPDASDVRHRRLRSLGYDDYSDPGNILRGADGKYYIVDTEWSALCGVTANQKISRLRAYAIDRFMLLNPTGEKIVNVKL